MVLTLLRGRCSGSWGSAWIYLWILPQIKQVSPQNQLEDSSLCGYTGPFVGVGGCSDNIQPLGAAVHGSGLRGLARCRSLGQQALCFRVLGVPGRSSFPGLGLRRSPNGTCGIAKGNLGTGLASLPGLHVSRAWGTANPAPSSGASGSRQWPDGELCSFPSEISCANHFICPLTVSWFGWGITELPSLLRAAIKQLQPVHMEDMPMGSPFSQADAHRVVAVCQALCWVPSRWSLL